MAFAVCGGHKQMAFAVCGGHKQMSYYKLGHLST